MEECLHPLLPQHTQVLVVVQGQHLRNYALGQKHGNCGGFVLSVNIILFYYFFYKYIYFVVAVSSFVLLFSSVTISNRVFVV